MKLRAPRDRTRSNQLDNSERSLHGPGYEASRSACHGTAGTRRGHSDVSVALATKLRAPLAMGPRGQSMNIMFLTMFDTLLKGEWQANIVLWWVS